MQRFSSFCSSPGYGWGERRLQAAGLDNTNIRLRVVQANIDQAEKWRPENSVEIFTDYLELTQSGGGLDGIAIVVWPETAVPFLLADDPEALAAIASVLPAGNDAPRRIVAARRGT